VSASGTLQAVTTVQVGSTISGQIKEILVDFNSAVRKGQLLARIDPTDAGHQATADSAEIARLEALLAQQERVLARQTELVQKNFISKNALDEATAQRDALKSQLATARARSDLSRNALGKTRVVAPVTGIIEIQVVAPGDYVKVGDPLFRMVSTKRLRAILPYPETSASQIRRGQPVRLTSPQSPGLVVSGSVEDIRPVVSAGSRAVDVIVRFDNDGRLLAGGTINGSVLIDRRDKAVLVPEQSVVLRPAGSVVYVVADGKAHQRVVATGARKGGMIEITRGLQGGETLALDGAGFLSDGAAVTIKEAPRQTATGKP